MFSSLKNEVDVLKAENFKLRSEKIELLKELKDKTNKSINNLKTMQKLYDLLLDKKEKICF